MYERKFKEKSLTLQKPINWEVGDKTTAFSLSGS